MVRRWVYFGVGWIFVALGVIGAVLPLLPTTPFLLLALWAFSHSSERFHSWLFHHPVLGPPLKAWQEERVISLRTKVVALSAMATTLLYTGLVAPVPRWAFIVMALLIAVGAGFVLSKPSRRSPRSRSPRSRSPRSRSPRSRSPRSQ